MSIRRLTLTALASLCALAGGLAFSAPALALTEHAFSSSFGGKGSEAGKFEEPEGVAVNDATHDVYVVDRHNNRVEEFTSAGVYIRQFDGSAAPTGALSAPTWIAIDNSGSALDPSKEDIYVTGEVKVGGKARHVVYKFSAAGVYEGQLTEGESGSLFEELFGVAVDPRGVVWVYQSSGEIDSFSDALVNAFLPPKLKSPFGTSPGFAVDSEDNLYVNHEPKRVGKINSSGKELVREIDSEITTGVAVDSSNDEVYLDNLNNYVNTIGVFSATGASIERFGSEHLTAGRGLAVDASDGTVYIADADADDVAIFNEVIAHPKIEEESVANVASTSATLQARVNPGNADTTYRFEYGPTASYGTTVPIPEGDVGSGISGVEVSTHQQDLQPNTTYHFRVVVSNAVQRELAGPDQQFTTQAVGGEFALPDGREWELVSPPSMYGAGIYAVGAEEGATIQAAAGGGAIAYATNGPIISGPGGNKAPEDTEVLSRRGSGGWESQDLATPNNEKAFRVGLDDEYFFFSADLSLAVVDRSGREALPPLPEGSQWTPYLRDDLSGEYVPLLTPEDTLPGSIYGRGQDESQVVGATPDFGHLVLGSPGVLKSGAAEYGLYEWAGGELQLVSVLPESEGGSAVGGLLGGASREEMGTSPRHAISDDGSRIVWAERAGEPLYLRDMTRGETVRVSPGGAQFQAASNDGSRVFFIESGELYVFEVTSGPDEALAGRRVGLTGAGSEVQNYILGASEDGSYVYFVAEGVIGDGAERGAGQGESNLYVEHYDGAEWTAPHFIAAQIEADGNNLKSDPARVSPNGQYLAFMSNRSLTGYDNHDARSGAPDEEVFLYDAGSGRLVCASCDPTGARPVGVFDTGLKPTILVDDGQLWQGAWLAANIPGGTNFGLTETFYQSRYLSSDGRLFFNSSDALVPADVDGTQDVYEYEPAGVGSCQSPGYGGSASDVFSEAAGGCVALISSGISGEESAFLDASEEGGEVFFMTSARLAPQDDDNAYDVYDAHECSGASPCTPQPPLTPPPCSTGDACKAAPTPQPTIFGAPSSETFSGAGNIVPSSSVPVAPPRSSPTRAQKLAKALQACRRKPRRKRAGCESQARKRFGVGKSKGAGKARAGRSLSVRAGR